MGIRNGFVQRESHLAAKAPYISQILGFLTVNDCGYLVCKDIFRAVQLAQDGIRSNSTDIRRDIVDQFDFQQNVLFCQRQAYKPL
jgi:hypothetical protein